MQAQYVVVKKQKGFRLSPEAQEILVKLCQKWGVNETSVLEVMLRKTAVNEKITVE